MQGPQDTSTLPDPLTSSPGRQVLPKARAGHPPTIPTTFRIKPPQISADLTFVALCQPYGPARFPRSPHLGRCRRARSAPLALSHAFQHALPSQWTPPSRPGPQRPRQRAAAASYSCIGLVGLSHIGLWTLGYALWCVLICGPPNVVYTGMSVEIPLLVIIMSRLGFPKTRIPVNSHHCGSGHRPQSAA